jgi:hypothetical protein
MILLVCSEPKQTREGHCLIYVCGPIQDPFGVRNGSTQDALHLCLTRSDFVLQTIYDHTLKIFSLLICHREFVKY